MTAGGFNYCLGFHRWHEGHGMESQSPFQGLWDSLYPDLRSGFLSLDPTSGLGKLSHSMVTLRAEAGGLGTRMSPPRGSPELAWQEL